MQFSEAWLREWVNPPISTAALADQLSMAGLEVDAVTPAAPPFHGVVVGEVKECEQHPNADKLRVCQVDVGTDTLTQIICGASNVAAGLKVPVALPGARLGADFKIRKTKLRGVASLGMICSAAELGLAESSPGILPLADDAPVGEDFCTYWALDDTCITVDLTPDRGDCLSLRGIAREVAALNELPLTEPPVVEMPAQDTTQVAVHLLAPQACPYYTCRVMRGINRQAQTPHWLQERLRRSGLQSVSPVVDVTNYVMLELGQPLHAFDLAQIQGEIQVRYAQAAEQLTVLSGADVILQPDTLLIADQHGPLALAGLMGGAESGVSATTEDVLLEAAFFTPRALAGQARRYGLHSEAAHRFERGVDPTLPALALQRATELLQDVVGGVPGPVVETRVDDALPVSPVTSLRRAQIGRILGIDLADDVVAAMLQRLGMQVTPVAEGWQVIPPSARFDLALEVDLIEELARLYGYDRIPAKSGVAPPVVSEQTETEADMVQAIQALVARDMQEVVTYSFISPELAQQFAPEVPVMRLQNPVAQSMSVMRPGLWPGLLSTIQYNLARQQPRIRIFEQGRVFRREADGSVQQDDYLAAAVCGPVAETHWNAEDRPVDFYDLKGDLEHLLGVISDRTKLRFVSSEHPALHPGQSARLVSDVEEKTLGWIGLLHPQLQEALKIPRVFVFELDLAGLPPSPLPAFTPVSRYPVIRRDLAFSVDRDCTWQQIRDLVAQTAPDMVCDIRLFDVYTGDQIAQHQKSLALRLTCQAATSTLEEAQVDAVCTDITQALAARFAATLRDQEKT
ncbi:MAG: phenylalanine--tRNA ligase subunit beta [Pseudomonadota bacterium]